MMTDKAIVPVTEIMDLVDVSVGIFGLVRLSRDKLEQRGVKLEDLIRSIEEPTTYGVFKRVDKRIEDKILSDIGIDLEKEAAMVFHVSVGSGDMLKLLSRGVLKVSMDGDIVKGTGHVYHLGFTTVNIMVNMVFAKEEFEVKMISFEWTNDDLSALAQVYLGLAGQTVGKKKPVLSTGSATK